MKFGYARVSTIYQNLDSQIDALVKNGVDKRLIYTDKYTGTRKKRPEFDKLMEKLEEGDILIVTRLSRLARSRKDIYEIMDFFKKKKIIFKCLKENFDLSTPVGKMIFGMFALVNECSNEIANENIREGFASARAKGKIFGRPHKLNLYEIKAIDEEIKNGKTIKNIAKDLNVTPPTIYNYLKRKVV